MSWAGTGQSRFQAIREFVGMFNLVIWVQGRRSMKTNWYALLLVAGCVIGCDANGLATTDDKTGTAAQVCWSCVADAPNGGACPFDMGDGTIGQGQCVTGRCFLDWAHDLQHELCQAADDVADVKATIGDPYNGLPECVVDTDCSLPVTECLVAYCVSGQCAELPAGSGSSCTNGICRNGQCEPIYDSCNNKPTLPCQVDSQWVGNCHNSTCCGSCMGWADGSPCLFDVTISETGSCSGGLCCKDGLCQQSFCF